MSEDAGWQAWIVPDRPGLRQFALGAVALLLPVPALALGPELLIPAMAVAVVLGVGLGLGWALVYGRDWLVQAPLTAVGIFAMTLGCTLHLILLPRIDVLLRVRSARQEVASWLRQAPADAPASAAPRYASGEGPRTFVLVSSGPRQGAAYTDAPFRSWTPFGYRDSCWLLVRREGTATVFGSRAELDQVLTEGR